MRRLAILVALIGMVQAHMAHAQSIAVEVDQTIGRSTEDISVAATQFRTFGELKPGIRFNVEAAWAARSDGEGDAFETAYPYAGRLQFIEAYAARTFSPGHC